MPDAATVKVTEPNAVADWLTGCVVKTGATAVGGVVGGLVVGGGVVGEEPTLRVAIVLVTEPAAFVAVTV